MTVFVDDIAQCDKLIKSGKADIIMNPRPDDARKNVRYNTWHIRKMR